MGCEDGLGYTPSKSEGDVYQPLSSYSHTHTYTSCGSTALFCLPCLEKEGELGDMKTFGGGGEPERERPLC